MSDATPVAALSPHGVPDERTVAKVVRDGPAIWERIRLRAEDRLSIVELQAHQLLDRDLTSEEAAIAAAAADSLAADLGQLELPSIARLARHLSRTLTQGDLDATTAVHIASTTDDLRTLLSSAIAQQGATSGERGEVLVLGSTTPELDVVCWVLASRGHTLSCDEARLSESAESPSGVIVAAVDGPTPAIKTLLRALGETWVVPVIVLHRSSSQAQLQDLATYSATLLQLDSAPDIVTSELARAMISQRSTPAALICGQGGATARLLTTHGFKIHKVAKPDRLIKAIEGKHCAVVFGSSVAASVAFGLARLIRATPATRRTPIIWQNDHDDEDQWLAATRLDIFAVDTVDDALASRLGSLLAKMAADLSDEDHLQTSVLVWEAAQLLIDRSLVAAYRSGSPAALATISIGNEVAEERITQLKETFGKEFRRGDIVGARADRNLVVVLQGVSRRVATNRLTELMERLDLDVGTTQVGVAVFPSDGQSAEELAAGADTAADLARQNDGPTVASTIWRPDHQQSADVVILDPDPVVGAMLLANLTEQGYRPELFEDGRDALQRLTDESGQGIPRLLLVDLDTPGLDGLTLVRRLRDAGLLSQMRVLVMAARLIEADLRMALELGVADVIRKPFSARLLLHRISRLVGDF